MIWSNYVLSKVIEGLPFIPPVEVSPWYFFSHCILEELLPPQQKASWSMPLACPFRGTEKRTEAGLLGGGNVLAYVSVYARPRAQTMSSESAFSSPSLTSTSIVLVPFSDDSFPQWTKEAGWPLLFILLGSNPIGNRKPFLTPVVKPKFRSDSTVLMRSHAHHTLITTTRTWNDVCPGQVTMLVQSWGMRPIEQVG
jgi:hypothetical protein